MNSDSQNQRNNCCKAKNLNGLIFKILQNHLEERSWRFNDGVVFSEFSDSPISILSRARKSILNLTKYSTLVLVFKIFSRPAYPPIF